MKFFLDTEFIEDGKTIELISLGAVREDGLEFYACNADADLSKANDWVKEHVLPRLPAKDSPLWMSRREIAELFRTFVLDLLPEIKGKPTFFGYYSDYDWVAVCQMYGRMLDLPKGFPMFCMDLKQLSVDVGSPKHPPDPEGEHNALVDAHWNRDLYKFLMEHRAKEEKRRLDFAYQQGRAEGLLGPQ